MPDDLAKLQSSPPAMAAWQNAQQNLRDRRYAASATAYRNLTRQFPGAAQLWIELGAAAAGELEFDLARAALERAAELAVGDPALLASVGRQYCQINRPDLADDCFARAVAADPFSAGARLTLASWLERNGRLDEAWECIEVCLNQHPGNVRALYLKAFLLHRKGFNEKAAAALHGLLKNAPALPLEGQFQAYHRLGVVMDALGQYVEALKFLQQAKALQRQTTDAATLERTYDALDQSRRELLAQLTPQTLKKWRDEATQPPDPHPLAFLGGAPRSGTTLIEQILGAHPKIAVFDEPPAFAREMIDGVLPPAGNSLTFQFLDQFAPAERGRSAGRYFKSLLLGNQERLSGKLLLDKNPSTTGSLHVWLRLFPRSKIIIALRDPRDVIVSCYFQNIALNATTVNFLSLERTVKFYATTMDVWLRLRELGGFDWLETRYEDVVSNLEQEGKRATNFLGLDWHDRQAAYYESARGKFLNAPTYHDVTKPVYNRAVGRWKNYAGTLAPRQADLEKYLRAFGYSGSL